MYVIYNVYIIYISKYVCVCIYMYIYIFQSIRMIMEGLHILLTPKIE